LFNVDNEAVSEKFYTVNSGRKSDINELEKFEESDDKLQQTDSNVSGKT